MPDTSMSVRLVVRVPPALVARVDQAAAAQCSKRSDVVRRLLLAGLDAQRAAGTPA